MLVTAGLCLSINQSTHGFRESTHTEELAQAKNSWIFFLLLLLSPPWRKFTLLFPSRLLLQQSGPPAPFHLLSCVAPPIPTYSPPQYFLRKKNLVGYKCDFKMAWMNGKLEYAHRTWFSKYRARIKDHQVPHTITNFEKNGELQMPTC